ncbi:MAG: terminase large subunit [Oscillospiraceae bacterium]|nr:terminase large subunit [Oscillospiraceae bacterium]
MENHILEYWQAIQKGTESVGKWVRLLYEKIVAGMEDGTYIFDVQKADRAIRFIERYIRHNKGPLAPKRLKLSLWQKAFLSILYGVVDQDGYRQFREVLLVVGRKMGKTLLAAAIMAYEAYLDGEFGSEIYCVAPKLEQSDLVYAAFEFSMEQSPELKRRTEKRKRGYNIPSKNATVRKVAFSEKKADGFSPMLTVCDELAAWPAQRGLRQYEVMVSGTGARNEPITLGISSSGYVDDGIYDELFKRGTRFLQGDSRETRLLPVLYTIDDIELWDDLEELRKSLPGLGVSVKETFIRDQIEIARESLSKKAEFLTKFCNIKQNSSQAWLPSHVVTAAGGEPLSLDNFRSSYCVVGIDLSQTRDLTACVAVIERDGELYVFAQFFLPAGRLDAAIARDGIPYDIYVERGLLTLSGDNFVDYKDCYNWVTNLVEDYEILPLKIGYDRYSAQYLVNDLKAYGFQTDDVYQGDNLWPVIEETRGLIEDGKVHIGDNDLLKIHLLNSAVQMNIQRGRGRLVKVAATEHIDGAAALLDAMTVRQKWAGEIGEQLRNKRERTA